MKRRLRSGSLALPAAVSEAAALRASGYSPTRLT